MLVVILALSLTGTSIGKSHANKHKHTRTISVETKGEQRDTMPVFNFEQKPYYQVLNYTRLYAKKYDVPEMYLFRLLRTETGFRASDTTYDPYSARILRTHWDGPYQMLTNTARGVWPDTLRNLTKAQFKHKMRFDLDFSCHTAVKYIHQLYEKYGAWDKAFSVYNQGPAGAHRINRYAKRITKGP
jgi:hypothetical protein